ncbi:Putative multidrug resistance protein MdtD [Streptomyces avidinii]
MRVVTAYMLAATAATPLWGKLGDQYGRKRLFQYAIVLFLLGSALCGLAQDMPQLIGFRALQGLGGGGLIVLSMAIVGDIVPPRERGKYQGLFGGVFEEATSVLGPLLGGLFVDNLSWRWVFYINLPIGLVALVVIAAVLHIPKRSSKHTIDYLGTFLIACVATCLVLVASLGGTWGWGSARIIGVAVLGAVLLAVFLFVERKATEPVLPLGLFRIRTFTFCSVISFIVGFAMFGAMVYLPTFLQIVQGVSPTMSGVHMLPMVIGMLYYLLHRLRPDRQPHRALEGLPDRGHGRDRDRSAPPAPAAPHQLHLGDEHLLLRLRRRTRPGHAGTRPGGAERGQLCRPRSRHLGCHLLPLHRGLLRRRDLRHCLHQPAGRQARRRARRRHLAGRSSIAQLEADPRAISALPAGLQPQVLDAYATAITDVFLYAVPIVLVAFVIAWFLKEDKLRTSVTAPDVTETLASNPVQRSSRDEVARALSVLGTREGRRHVYEKITEKAGYDLLPAASWMLLPIKKYGSTEPSMLAERANVPLKVITDAARQVEERGLAAREGLALVLTEQGQVAAARLAEARQESLAELLGDWWGPDRPTDLVKLVQEINTELCGSDAEEPYDSAPRRDHAAP